MNLCYILVFMACMPSDSISIPPLVKIENQISVSIQIVSQACSHWCLLCNLPSGISCIAIAIASEYPNFIEFS